MREQIAFNVFDQFAGCFIPYGLLSLKKLSAGAKICYSLLAQQANTRGVSQLNLPMLAVSLGETEGNIVRYLTELEEKHLIKSSRGNANKEDVRIIFQRQQWWEYTESSRHSLIPTASVESQPQLFAVETSTPQALPERQALDNKKSGQTSKQRRRRRWYERPRSRHSLEVCLTFITFQKEVLGRRSIYDPEGLAESIFHTGKQDDEIDDWLTEQENVA
jgi:hypothetical protein